MPDLISGRVSMMFENMPGAVSYIQAGKLNALAVTGLKRTPALPDVKTVAESGVPGYGLSPYFRLSFATSMENLHEACRRIGAAGRALVGDA